MQMRLSLIKFILWHHILQNTPTMDLTVRKGVTGVQQLNFVKKNKIQISVF